MVRVCSIPLREGAAARRSGHSRARGTGSGGDEGARGGGRRPRRSGLARRAPARARHLASGRGCGATGCGPPEAGGRARRRRPNPAGATPPGTAAARPPRRTRGDTAWLVSRVSGNALCTGLRDGYATTERNARRIDRPSVAHARNSHNLAALALPIDSRSVLVV